MPRSNAAEQEDLNWVIVRENTEGEYSGVGGRMHQGHPIEVATDLSLMTRAGVERIQRFAFRLAQSRPRKLLTVITKSNAQRHAMVMWDEIAAQVAQEFPDVTWDRELVDAATARMVNRPASLDTIVATNLHADILSDLAAALAGSLGIAPTANINPERLYPSMFEPIHGSAFDIMGKGWANPVGTFWSVVMLLEHLGEIDAAARVMKAIEHVTANPSLHTRDLGGTATTAQVTEAVCAQIAATAKDSPNDRLKPRVRTLWIEVSHVRPNLAPSLPCAALHSGRPKGLGILQPNRLAAPSMCKGSVSHFAGLQPTQDLTVTS